MSHASHTSFQKPATVLRSATLTSLQELDHLELAQDVDLLATVLAPVIPVELVHPLAKRLIGIFQTYGKVLSARPAELLRVIGMNQDAVTLLKGVEASVHRLAKTEVIGRDVLGCWKSLLTYCQTKMAHKSTEQFRVLYLDNRNQLICDELVQQGTVGHVPVYPREIMKRALEVNSSAMILVHNHPSGDPEPSEEDITMTECIRSAADVLDITIHDHLIIGSEGSFSFKSNGLL